ncbi:MBL fold metallo-hydrolase [Niveibacterium terrae]|uniref:MBL fold metallo-hydrolase n=1 Tax=Niveibacterium terrae TaxID=3373598 RepID=UPI003A8CA166
MNEKISRRDALKITGFAGLALGGMALQGCNDSDGASTPSSQKYTYFDKLPSYIPGTETLGANEMRISIMGSSPVLRRSQAGACVLVELGNGESFVFDCGTGATINFGALAVPMSKARRVFLTHLHGDHFNDLTNLYCFGPQEDGKSPLYIWGPSRSHVCNPDTGTDDYDDGTCNFAMHFREMCRWHTEAQSFVPTRYDDAEGDGYDLFATELDWLTGGGGSLPATWTTNPTMDNKAHLSTTQWVAYQDDAKGVKITFFPAVHDRNGSISYRLEWNGLSMVYSGDTKPNQFMIENASGVDVLVHELVVPPETWSSKQGGSPDPNGGGVKLARTIEENSHTPEKAFGYIMSQLKKAPRLAVGTHFQAEDDTADVALQNIRTWYAGDVAIVTDLVVINVSSTAITTRRADVTGFTWNPPAADPTRTMMGHLPKYWDTNTANIYAPFAPLSQFDSSLLAKVIDPCLYDNTQWNCGVTYVPKTYSCCNKT